MSPQSIHLPLATMFAKAAPIVIDAAIKGVVLLAAAGLLTLAQRRGSAAQRHFVWLLALGGTLVLPVLSAFLPAWRILPRWLGSSAVSSVEWSMVESSPAPRTIADGPSPDPKNLADLHRQIVADGKQATADAAASTPSPLIPVTPSWTSRQIWELGLLAIWGFGAAALLFRYLLGMLSIRRLGRRARPVDDEGWLTMLDAAVRGLAVRQRVLLLESPQCTIPMTWGIVRPAVLVPAKGKSWPVARRQAVLAHELAHVKRRDCLAQLVAQLARALYWFNPLAWLAWRRLLVESERACDDLVLALGSKASDYAEHLLTVASGPRAGMMFSPAALAMARPSQLQGRLVAILDERRNRRKLTRFAVAAALLLVTGAVVPLSVLKAIADDQGTPTTGRRAADEPPAATAAPTPATSGGKSTASSPTLEKRTGEAPASATLNVVRTDFNDGPESQGGVIFLPAYQGLCSPEILKAVAPSEKQKKELLQLSQTWSALIKRFQDPDNTSPNLSPQQQQAKREELEVAARQLKVDCRKKVEGLLTPAQMETYKRLVLPKMAYQRLYDPATVKRIPFSKEQQEHIKQIQANLGLAMTDTPHREAELLAILDQEQQKKLRAEAERDYFASFEARADASAFMDDTTYSLTTIGPIADSEPARPPKAKRPYILLPVYEMLSSPAARERFGISAAQEKQFQEIASRYDAARERLRQAAKALTPAEHEGKWPELRRQSATTAKEVRRQIEALLTPKQLTAVKNAIVDMFLPMNLNLEPGSRYNLVEKIGLSDKQMAALRRKRQESKGKVERAFLEMQEKTFAVLTPEQTQILRQEMDKSGW